MGDLAKVALVACIRKLLGIINASAVTSFGLKVWYCWSGTLQGSCYLLLSRSG